jgi:hypothetical protein
MEVAGHEGLIAALALLILPFVTWTVLIHFFLPAKPIGENESAETGSGPDAGAHAQSPIVTLPKAAGTGR